MVGFTYRRTFHRKWLLNAHREGGGFGVGSESAFGGTRRADWHFAKHSGAAFGFGVQHFTISDTVFDNTRVSRTLTISPLHTAPSLRAAFNF